jgi:hypothetical protein
MMKMGYRVANASQGREAVMVQEKFDAVKVLASAFAISSIGGLASLLRSQKPMTLRSVLSSLLYSGVMGLIIALLWYNILADAANIYFLLGVSGLAGIGGTTVVDFIIQLIKRGGIDISIRPRSDDAAPPQPPQ